MTKNKSGSTKVSALNDKQYFKLRNAAVRQVNTSKDQTIADVANEHHISISTLWGWCVEDLGPNQFKGVKERSQKISTARAVHTRQAKKLQAPPLSNFPKPENLALPRKNKPWDKKKAKLQTPEHQATVQAALDAVFGQVPPAPKTLGDLMKKDKADAARITLKQTLATGELPKKIDVNIPHRELMDKLGKKICCQEKDDCCKTQKVSPAVAINLDVNGKFISYNVTGEVNVLVFSERKVTQQ